MAASTWPIRRAHRDVRDAARIYNGYRGFVQRITDEGCGLFEGGNWTISRFRSAP